MPSSMHELSPEAAYSADLGTPFTHDSTSRRCFSLHDIETHVLIHRAEVIRRGYERIVAIARSGLYAGAMLSHYTGIEMDAIQVDRGQRTVRGGPAEATGLGARLLLVDDLAGKGYTLVTAQEHFERQGWQVDVFVTASDELSRVRPEFGIHLGDGVRPTFPWERTVMAVHFDSERRNARDRDRWNVGFDLDGVFLDDVPGHLYLEQLELALAMREDFLPYPHRPPQWLNDGSEYIISGRMATETAQTEAWLTRHGMRHKGLHLRPRLDLPPPEHKAFWIASLAISEFIESELPQALEIARLAPFCVVWHYDGKRQMLQRIDGHQSR
jgi:hypoxanthine phosphoribosyltransferase